MVEKTSNDFLNGTRNLPSYVYVVYPKVPGFEGVLVRGVHESYNCGHNFCNDLPGNSCCGIRIKMSSDQFNEIKKIFPKRFLENNVFGRLTISIRYSTQVGYTEFEISGYSSTKNYEIVKHLSKLGLQIKSEV
ncbi:MAG: hypothetical protein M1385_01710 [Candidatus Marsarchaeota archaeon]|nr:hypothetical protein [Candidatus Marsarchaeota archaeon]